MKPGILVIGSANVDLVMQTPRLPGPGETITGGVFFHAFGGKGANQAVAAARAGAKVEFVSCLGNDAYGQEIRSALEAEGLGLSHCRTSASSPNGCALIIVDTDGQNQIAVAPGANSDLKPEDLESDGLFEGTALVVMQMEVPLETVRQALRLARQADAPVLLNYAPVPEGNSIEIDNHVRWLVVNEQETASLAGLPVTKADEARNAANILLEKGPEWIIVTMGVQGLVAVSKMESFVVPAFPVKAVDATAAGDTFCGSLAVALGEGRNMLEALRFASAAAALSTTVAGAQPSIPHRREIEALLAKHA